MERLGLGMIDPEDQETTAEQDPQVDLRPCPQCGVWQAPYFDDVNGSRVMYDSMFSCMMVLMFSCSVRCIYMYLHVHKYGPAH